MPINQQVTIGRKTIPSANGNLHISREQVLLELKPDAMGRILICMTNVRRREGGGAVVATRSACAAPTPPRAFSPVTPFAEGQE